MVTDNLGDGLAVTRGGVRRALSRSKTEPVCAVVSALVAKQRRRCRGTAQTDNRKGRTYRRLHRFDIGTAEGVRAVLVASNNILAGARPVVDAFSIFLLHGSKALPSLRGLLVGEVAVATLTLPPGLRTECERRQHLQLSTDCPVSWVKNSTWLEGKRRSGRVWRKDGKRRTGWGGSKSPRRVLTLGELGILRR